MKYDCSPTFAENFGNFDQSYGPICLYTLCLTKSAIVISDCMTRRKISINGMK